MPRVNELLSSFFNSFCVHHTLCYAALPFSHENSSETSHFLILRLALSFGLASGMVLDAPLNCGAYLLCLCYEKRVAAALKPVLKNEQGLRRAKPNP